MQHHLLYSCSAGHQFNCPASPPQPRFSFILEDIDACRSRSTDGRVSYQDFFRALIPRTPKGPSWGTTVLHEQPPIACQSDHCNEEMTLQSIRTSWPAVLQIGPPEHAAADKARSEVRTMLSFSVAHSNNRSTVQYELVGNIRYHDTPDDGGTAANHYTCRFLQKARVYSYNGMLHSGQLQEIGPASSMLDVDPLVTTWMYVRTSDTSVSAHLTMFYRTKSPTYRTIS